MAPPAQRHASPPCPRGGRYAAPGGRVPRRTTHDDARERRARAGEEVTLDIEAGTTAIALGVTAFLVEDAARADRGTLSGLSCPMSAAFRIGGTVYAELVIKAASEKGRLRGTVIAMNDGDALAQVCTFTAKRTSTAPPTVGYC